MDATRESLFEGIKAAQAGNRIGDIGSAVQRYVEARGYSVVRDFVGHGVGAKLHEDPSVPNYGTPGRGVRLLPGMTIAIEPMINAGVKRSQNADRTVGRLSQRMESFLRTLNIPSRLPRTARSL